MSTDTILPPPPMPDAAPGLSEPARILDTFIAPSKTFTDIRRNAMWWGPLVIMILVSLCFTVAVDQKVTFRKVVDNQIASSPKAQDRLEKAPADQREQQLSMQTKMTAGIAYAFPIFLVIVSVIGSAIMLAFFKFGANADLTFKRMLAVTMYAGLPGSIKYALAAVVVFVGAAGDSFNMNNPIGTNLGFFLDPAGNKFLYTLGSALDVFTFWSLFLTALGVTYVCKVKKGTAYGIVFGWFAVTILLFGAMAAAFS